MPPIIKNGKQIKSQAITIDVDSLAVGYGFVARTQLGLLLGVDHQYNKVSGQVPVIDNWQRSSQEGIYVAGDSTGLLGADAAICEGQIAALAIAKKYGKISVLAAEKRVDKIRRRRNRIQRFRYGFDRFSDRQSGLLDLPNADTVVCRCENTTRQQLDEAIAQGVKDITSLKMRTRLGMGDCQGKTCSSYALDRLNAEGFDHDIGIISPPISNRSHPIRTNGRNRMKKYDVIIAGGGVIGAATAYYLSKHKNLSVALVDIKKTRQRIKGIRWWPMGYWRVCWFRLWCYFF